MHSILSATNNDVSCATHRFQPRMTACRYFLIQVPGQVAAAAAEDLLSLTFLIRALSSIERARGHAPHRPASMGRSADDNCPRHVQAPALTNGLVHQSRRL